MYQALLLEETYV